MTATDSSPPLDSRRLRWRWMATGLLVTALTVLAWLSSIEDPSISKAQAVRLGQSSNEMLEVMGRDCVVAVRGKTKTFHYGRKQQLQWTLLARIQSWTGMNVPFSTFPKSWPVQIRCDDDRVTWIKRGGEELGARP